MRIFSIIFAFIYFLCGTDVSARAETRTWTDVTGQHQVDADFVKLRNGSVELRKTDGAIVILPLKKLSAGDQQFVRKMQRLKTRKAVGESAIRKALEKRITINFNNTPLRQALDDIEKEAGIEIYLDNRNLQELGLGADSPITAAYEDDRLENVLANTLKDLDRMASWDIFNDVVRITTQETLAETLRVTVYRITRPMLDRRGRVDSDTLIGQIQTIVEPASWDEMGGEGAVSPYRGHLVIVQTHKIHDEIAKAFRANLKAVSSSNKKPLPNSAINLRNPRASVDLLFEEELLHKAITMIGEKAKTQIDVDWNAIEELGVNRNSPVSMNIRGLPPASALSLVLHQIDPDLTWTWKNNRCLITTREVAAENMIVMTHQFRKPVNDSFIELITTTIEPESWDDMGGDGMVTVDNTNHLVRISQLLEVHAKIEKLFADLKALDR